MQRLHESVQTTVYLFETSDATKRICPMTFTLVMAGTLDPLIHGFVGLRRQMVHSYTQGIVTEDTPMNQGPICAKVYPEGIQPNKGNNCGLIPEKH